MTMSLKEKRSAKKNCTAEKNGSDTSRKRANRKNRAHDVNAEDTIAPTANAGSNHEEVPTSQIATAPATAVIPATTNGASPKATAKSTSTDCNTAIEPEGNSLWHVVLLPIAHIDPNPFQPRVAFNTEEMADLIASVRAHGVLQPVTVRTTKPVNGSGEHNDTSHHASAIGHGPNVVRYHLVSGERRLRACKEAGRKTIPAIVRDDLSNAAAAELALVENLQRSNLNPIEEAVGYKRLMLEFRLKEERIAKKVGKSVATIKEMMKLLILPEPVQKLIADKSLTLSHGQHLTRLAAFEAVCTRVAQKAADDHLTALSLSSTPLPNAQELKKQGLIIELGYKTEFDWRNTCGECPHKAYVQGGYSSYCLLPIEWHKKNEAAIELKQQEAAQVMEAARQEGSNVVDTQQMASGSYRNLSYSTPPAGCTPACPCRGEAIDPHDPTRKIPVCLDVKRFSELVQAERQAHEEARARQMTVLWQEAKDVLCAEQQSGAPHKTALLLARPLFTGYRNRYYRDEGDRTLLLRKVGAALDIVLPWDDLLDPQTDDAKAIAHLQALDPYRLLLLTACLSVAQEAQDNIFFAGPTPELDLVLGRTTESQSELTDEELTDENLTEAEQFTNECTTDEGQTGEERTGKEPMEA